MDAHDKGWDFARFMGMYVEDDINNCTGAWAYNTDQDEICLVLTWTGAGTGEVKFQYQLGGNFLKFLGQSDDFSFICKQTGNSGDGADVELAIEIYDNAGANISDASLSSAVTSVADWVDRDCAITDPDGDMAIEGGDHFTVIMTVAGTIESGDILIMTIPKIKYRALK